MSLSEIIIEKIRKEGPISFCDFMEMALYYPGYGYYTSDEDKIGKQGDYYTSPYLTSVFGYMIAKQLEEMWSILGKKPFTVVEYGAGSGTLCNDILAQLKNNKHLFKNFNYYIIEKSQWWEEKMLSLEKAMRISDINDIPPINGCILSNELADNFPVHRVVMEDELMEVFVDYKDGFTELIRPAGETLKNYMKELRVNLPKGFHAEINLDATKWIKEISEKLKTGFALTIDYGYPSSELYSNRRHSGTLVCYHKHTTNFSPYDNIGKQDITTHINFSAIDHWGLKYGLHFTGYTTQANFLLALGLTNHLRAMEQSQHNRNESFAEKAFMVRTFLMDMGNKLKVLIQHKGIEKPKLSGLQFAQSLV